MQFNAILYLIHNQYFMGVVKDSERYFGDGATKYP